MRSPLDYLSLARHLGVGWVLFRLGYAWRCRTGGLRRATPLLEWNDVSAPVLRLAPPAPATAPACAASTVEADDVLQGRFRLFSHRVVEAGFPPAWRRNQLTGEQGPAEPHWSDLGDFPFGDIKGIWELSRFTWGFALVRAHRRTGAARYAEAYWTLFADWCEQNPPNRGPNWMCGQEATFRLMAVLFAAENLPDVEAHRDDLARFVLITGRRIAANLDYALSQKNNHGISECVGLVTAALALPDHRESAAWLTCALGSLEAQLAELVYEDGGFAQHSLVYHRVLLHDLVWLKNRLTGAGEAIPEWLNSAGRRATEFLLTLVDAESGSAPLYGSNDGANVLPLADADFLDLRPTALVASAAFGGVLPFAPGPADEAVAWLIPGGENLPRRPFSTPTRWLAPAAGCAQVRNAFGRLFLRCPTRFRHRPAQADMLHVDVWAHGRRMALDGGSFSYNSRERFTALGSAAQHNVLTVDEREPMEKFSRFLYLPWPHGEVRETETGYSARHDGYDRLGVNWIREIVGKPGRFVVEDRIDSQESRCFRWHWRLADQSWNLDESQGHAVANCDGKLWRVSWSGNVPVVARLIRADPETATGWWAPHYGAVEPTWSLLLETRGGGAMNLTTEFSAI